MPRINLIIEDVETGAVQGSRKLWHTYQSAFDYVVAEFNLDDQDPQSYLVPKRWAVTVEETGAKLATFQQRPEHCVEVYFNGDSTFDVTIKRALMVALEQGADFQWFQYQLQRAS